MRDNVKMMWRVEASQKKENVFYLYIYDDVCAKGAFNWNTWEYEESETSAKYFRDALDEIPEGSEIELHINSNGGSVKEGTAIYNLLKQHNSKITGVIDGVAHSIAFLILQACDVRIAMLGTSALIHNMWMGIAGNATQLRKAADDLDAMMESNRQVFLTRANETLTEDLLKELMEVETYLTPQQMLDYGLVDKIDGQANEQNIHQLAQAQITQLKRELANQASVKEEFAKLTQSVSEGDETNEPEQKESLLTIFRGLK